MANDLGKQVEEIQKQSSDAIDAVEAYRKKQQSEKSRNAAWIILTPIVIIIIAIVIYNIVSNNAKNNEIEKVLSNPDSVATVTLVGNNQCSVTNNLHILNIKVGGDLGIVLGPGEKMSDYCDNIGEGQCVYITVIKNPGTLFSYVIADHEICSH
jgi:hypothetical protein